MAIEDYLGGMNNYLSPYKSGVDTAYSDLSRVTGDAVTLPNKLKEALSTKLNNNADLIGQKNEMMGQYFAAPATARDKYQNIWNPFEREKLVAQDRTQKLQGWSTFNDILGDRMGQVSDIVNEGVAGWQGVVQQANVLAQAAQQKLQNAWNEYTQAAQMQQQADQLAAQKSQWEAEFGLTKEKWDWDKANSGKGGSSGRLPGISAVDQATAEAWNAIVDESTDEAGNFDTNKAWAAINRNQGALRATGVDVDKLWAWQRNTWPAVETQATAPETKYNWFSNNTPTSKGLVARTPEEQQAYWANMQAGKPVTGQDVKNNVKGILNWWNKVMGNNPNPNFKPYQ